MNLSRFVNFFKIILIVSLYISLYFYISNLGLEVWQNQLAKLGWMGFAGFTVGRIASILVPPLPGTGFVVVAAVSYGWWQAVLVLFVADLIGLSINFWLTRTWGQSSLGFITSPEITTKLTQFSQAVLAQNNWFLLASMLNSWFSWAAFGAGLSRISYSRFVLIASLSRLIVLPTIALFSVGLLGSQVIIYIAFSGLLGLGVWQLFRQSKQKFSPFIAR